jgi:hypothetical protein
MIESPAALLTTNEINTSIRAFTRIKSKVKSTTSQKYIKLLEGNGQIEDLHLNSAIVRAIF